MPVLRGNRNCHSVSIWYLPIEEHGDKLATKEAVAMALEQFGKVRVVMVTDGKEPKR